MRDGFWRRLGKSSKAWWEAFDNLWQVTIGNCFYLPFGLGACPHPDETISSRVGRHAEAGERWALIAEAVIDRIFHILTGQKGHCRKAIEHLPPY